MANAIYNKAKEAMLSGTLNFTADTLKIVLITDAYVFSQAHQYYSDIGANHIGTDQTLVSKTVTSGVFDAGDVVFAAVTAGSDINAVAIYKDTGVAGSSPLICYLDTVASGLPVTSNGGDITVTFDSGAYKIFAL